MEYSASFRWSSWQAMITGFSTGNEFPFDLWIILCSALLTLPLGMFHSASTKMEKVGGGSNSWKHGRAATVKYSTKSHIHICGFYKQPPSSCNSQGIERKVDHRSTFHAAPSQRRRCRDCRFARDKYNIEVSLYFLTRRQSLLSPGSGSSIQFYAAEACTVYQLWQLRHLLMVSPLFLALQENHSAQESLNFVSTPLMRQEVQQYEAWAW
jgi:hypothetical protein